MNCSEFMQMLDSLIDGELDADRRAECEAHAWQCKSCGEQLRAAEQLRVILSQMDEGISVPLPAQAGWRGAIRKEAARRRRKRIYTAVGAVAAACVLTLGVTAMLRDGDGALPAPNNGAQKVAYVQTDGITEMAVLDNSAAPVQARAMPVDAFYAQRRIVTEDPQAAHAYLMDVVAEYNGVMESESGDLDEWKIYLQIPSGNVADFISAAEHVGVVENAAFEYDAAAETVGICVVIVAE